MPPPPLPQGVRPCVPLDREGKAVGEAPFVSWNWNRAENCVTVDRLGGEGTARFIVRYW